jgi:4-aminobutyrate aminotransferase
MREYRANAQNMGEHFMGRLRELARSYPCVGEVRGQGLMIGLELIEPGAARAPARLLADAVVNCAYHNGLLLLTCGVSTVRFMPPLSVKASEIDEAVELLGRSLDLALAEVGGA